MIKVTATVEHKGVTYALAFDYNFPADPPSFFFQQLEYLKRAITHTVTDLVRNEPSRQSMAQEQGGMNMAGEDLAQDIVNLADRINSAVEEGDAEEAMASVSKLRNKLSELERELSEVPQGTDVSEGS